MIIGRRNRKAEVERQDYMHSKLQPIISEMVMELLQTKPEDPVPLMVEILEKQATKAEIAAEQEAMAQNNDTISGDALEEYYQLFREKEMLEDEVTVLGNTAI